MRRRDAVSRRFRWNGKAEGNPTVARPRSPEGSQRLAGGEERQGATLPPVAGPNESRTLKGCQTGLGNRRRRADAHSGTLPGCGPFRLITGGIAKLNPRPIADTLSG